MSQWWLNNSTGECLFMHVQSCPLWFGYQIASGPSNQFSRYLKWLDIFQKVWVGACYNMNNSRVYIYSNSGHCKAQLYVCKTDFSNKSINWFSCSVICFLISFPRLSFLTLFSICNVSACIFSVHHQVTRRNLSKQVFWRVKI